MVLFHYYIQFHASGREICITVPSGKTIRSLYPVLPSYDIIDIIQYDLDY